MRNLTVLGKLLTLAVVLTSVVGCAASQPYVQSGSIRDTTDFNNIGEIAKRFNLLTMELSYRLTPEQKRKQTAAVYAALESDYGEVYTWYDDDARGMVKAVHGYPRSFRQGYCRVIFSQIERGASVRSFKETACANHDTPWTFQPME